MQPWHIRRVRVIADLLWLRGFHMQCFVVLRDCVTRKVLKLRLWGGRLETRDMSLYIANFRTTQCRQLTLTPEPGPTQYEFCCTLTTPSLSIRRKLQGHSKIVKIQSDISLPPDIFPTFSFRKVFSWHGPFNSKFRVFKFIVEVSVKMYAFLASSFISFLKPYSKIYNVKKTRIGHTGIPKHCNSQWCPFKCHVRLGKICAINTYFTINNPFIIIYKSKADYENLNDCPPSCCSH